jgi:ATP-binding cassette subfamily F protein 3
MLTINEVSYFIGNKQLYDKCSLFVKPTDKIGLIGMNGTGKSTLIKLITGELVPDSGNISLQTGYTIGYLNQDMLSLRTTSSIKDVAMEAFSHVLELQKQEEEILHEMETNYRDELVDELTKIQESIERLGGYDMESRAEAVLEGVGFRTQDLDKPLENFSGGWRMRVLLAKLLLQHPSLLILDEPTNHLDIESIKWLEKYLIDYDGAIIVISHDRFFLDNVVNRIVELENKRLSSYSGNYSFYQKEKAERLEIQENAYKNQQKHIEKTTEFINKFRSKATKAKQVQSKIKMLDKLDKIEAVEKFTPKIRFNFNILQQSGKSVAVIDNISKSYGDLTIFKNSSATIERGDKIGLIGVNGKGKSTLLRMIAKTEEPDSGQVIHGPNVIPAFYAQHQLESLNLENNIVQELTAVDPERTVEDIRKIAGMFLFSNDDVYKVIKVLSGGEKARVALAKILLSRGNFLLLDEPTNHLDVVAIEILAQAIMQYQGTCIIISHDRYFVSKVTNKIWYIDDCKLREYPGDYEAFENSKKNKWIYCARLV